MFTPNPTSGTSVTVTVTCTGPGTVVATLNANTVVGSSNNPGPASAVSAASTLLTCGIASSVSLGQGRAVSAAAAGAKRVVVRPNLVAAATPVLSTTNGGWAWATGFAGTTRTIDGVVWNFLSQRFTSTSSGTKVTIEATRGVGIQANSQKMSDRGGANGMFMDDSIVGVAGAQVVTSDDGCTYGKMCADRGLFKISFSPPAVDPVLHFSGLGGGGYDSATNGKTTSWTEFEVLNPGVKMTLLGKQNLQLVGASRIELVSKNPTTNCGTTSNAYGATATAGCGSVKFTGTFSTITLQADLNSVNNAVNPYVGGRLEDAFIIAATVTVPPQNNTVNISPVPTTTTTTTTTVAPGNSNSNTNSNSNSNSNTNINKNTNSNTNINKNVVIIVQPAAAPTTTTSTTTSTTTTTLVPPATCPVPSNNQNSNSSSNSNVNTYSNTNGFGVVPPGGSIAVDPSTIVYPSKGAIFDPNSILIWDGKNWVNNIVTPSGSYTVVDGKIVFTPSTSGATANDVVAKNLSFKITDSSGISTVSNVTVVVGPVDKIDTAKLDSLVASANNATVYTPADTPVDVSLAQLFTLDGTGAIKPSSIVFVGDTGTAKKLATADGTWTLINGAIHFVPNKGFTGTTSVQIAAVDSYGNTVFDTVTVVVGKTTAARALVNQHNTVRPGSPAWLNALAGARTIGKATFKPSSVVLWNGSAWTTHVKTANGQWDVFRGQVRFLPADGFTGKAVVPVRATDTSGLYAFADLTVYVRDGFQLLPATGAGISHWMVLSNLMLLVGAALVLRRRRIL